MPELEEARACVVDAMMALWSVVKALESSATDKTKNKRKAQRLVTQAMCLKSVEWHLRHEQGKV